ncbi:MAG TPA: phosphatase PAP2 family protein [Gaiellaceae bacterium]|nr:phosphatase PAP2 family protein [Gaiellaceae bacterium]HET8653259.1 phosphatase PAP2 family protein [Gaiellaceae bacterium]
MTAAAAAVSRQLPRGWLDLFRQLLIWFGFVLAYQVVRGLADRSDTAAFDNARGIVDFERRATGLWELSLQSWAQSSHSVAVSMQWTYWLSQFAVVGIALLWVYLRRHDSFTRFRNVLMLANVVGLVGYVLLPTAPPRMLPEFGFVDTLATLGAPNHGSSVVQLASNPYAAMPSLHSADALIVGIALAVLARSWLVKLIWLAWPVWVWISVMATGNHYWLDILAGVAVAMVAAAVVYWRETWGFLSPAFRVRV